MKHYDRIKTAQLIVFLILTGAALLLVMRDQTLYQMIASNAHIKRLCTILWAVMGLSFVFMFLDFSSFADLKRENSELDFAVTNDPLTGVANRYSCDAYIAQFAGKAVPDGMGCMTLDLVSLPEINRQHGHDGGDEAIRSFSGILQEAGEEAECFIGRNGGNKFLVIFRNCTEASLSAYQEAVARKTAEWNRTSALGAIRYTVGTAIRDSETDSMTALISLSDRRALEAE